MRRRRSRAPAPRWSRPTSTTRPASARRSRAPHGVFAVTNFWEHFSAEKEIAQAGNLARAAKAAGSGHVIWSTLEDTRRFIPLDDDRMPTLQEKYKVPHFDAKGAARTRLRRARAFRRRSCYTSLLLGELHLLRAGPGARRGRKARVTLPLGRQEDAGDRCRRTSASVALRDLQARSTSTSASGSESRACSSQRRRVRRRVHEGARRGGHLHTTSTRRLPGASASPAPTRWETCTSSSATSKSAYAGRATSSGHGR